MHPDELNAIQAASAVDPEEIAGLEADEHAVLGRRNRRYEGHAKSTGREVYTDDLALPGMLHGKILRSPHPHARIVTIDTSAAEALDGVHAVLTGADMPTPFGIIPWTRDEYALAVDRVRHIGDAVAAVAAVDEETATQALEAISVEYEVLPAILEPREALESSAVQIHEPTKEGRNGNVTKHVLLEFGPVDEAMDGAQFRNLVDFLGRPTTIDRCVDAMGQQATSPAIGLFAARSTEHPSCGSRHTRVDGTQGIG